jgi:hypothetical protein
MCIIAIYTGEAKPDKKTLDRMIIKNPDGVGVAWNDGRAVHFRKGLKDSAQVMRIYERVKRDALAFVFHARIATSGGVSAQKCHPFPISNDERALNVTTYDGTRPCAFHNGVFPLTVEKGFNDTQTFIKNSIYPIHDADGDGLKTGRFDALLEFATRNSRFVLLYPDDIRVFGEWEKDNGVYYSNGGFKDYGALYATRGAQYPTYTRGGYYGGRYYSDYLYGGYDYED